MPFPQSRTLTQAIATVRNLTNEPSLPIDATVGGFLNDGLEHIASLLNPEYYVENILTNAGDTTVSLPAQVWQPYKLTFSTALPTAAGVVEYPMTELGPHGFVDQTGSAPTIMGGPVVFYRLIQDSGGVIELQIFPTSPGGYVNSYCSQRPNLWDVTNGNSVSSIDTVYQLLPIYWACSSVCANRENFKRAAYFEDKFEKMLQRAETTIKQRRARKGAQVRDVTAQPQVLPAWFPR